jgi:predicted ATPase
MDRVSDVPGSVEFGRFWVVPHRRQLLADGRPIKLGGRAFDVLMALIEASGAVVGKEALMKRTWPGRIVEENRLQAEISALRRVFGPDRELIRTVGGRGYQFTGEIRVRSADVGEREVSGAIPAPAEPSRPLTNLPEPVSELIGREADLSEVMELVATQRLITLIGEGGIGKTRLGLAVGRKLVPEFADGVWVAELAPLADPDLVPVTVARALGFEFVGGVMSPERIANAIGPKQLMLVLDNCEHVIEAAANMADALLRSSRTVRVLATSREQLRTEGECLYRVPPLSVPAEGTADVEEVLQHSAVRLFVARARAGDPRFSPDGRIAAAAGAICRRLDGIPLAIELAAARGAALGVEELASRLDDRFHLLTGGRRTALPRHQTLRATIDWSYELLPESERIVLRRLAIFAGGFTLAATTAVTTGTEINSFEVVDCVASLVAKSLVSPEIGDGTGRYRLLETTRAYALEKLTKSSELESVAQRHAEYYRELFERAEAEWKTRPTNNWLADYTHQIDNLRAALDWSFSTSGNAPIGVTLTIASVPLWFQMSLMEECRRYVEKALSSIEPRAGGDAHLAMRLFAGLGASLFLTEGTLPETGAAWTNALEIAESLGDTEYQAGALWGLYACHIASGECRMALAFAQRFRSLAAKTSNPANLLIGDRMTGFVLHYLGNLADARLHIDRMLDRYVAPLQRSPTIGFQFDQSVLARIALARILWLQGYPDQAMRTAQRGVEDARALDPALSLCNVLAEAACPVAHLVGDVAALQHFVAMLLDQSARHALTVWQAWGRIFEGMLLITRDEVVSGLDLLRTALSALRETPYLMRYTASLGALAEGLRRVGQAAQGIAAIDEALSISDQNEERWYIAELLRIKGELLLLEGATEGSAAAEDHFRQALDWARRQGALSWELRAATSLARLWRDQGRSKDGYELLAPIYDRFTEGFGTTDLRTAKALIGDLR